MLDVGDFRLVCIYVWRIVPFGLFESLTGGAVKQDGVFFGFPDRCKLDTARTMQTEVDSAWPPPPFQQPLRDLKNSDFNVVFPAQGVRNILP